jgi:hypothetical protein
MTRKPKKNIMTFCRYCGRKISNTGFHKREYCNSLCYQRYKLKRKQEEKKLLEFQEKLKYDN